MSRGRIGARNRTAGRDVFCARLLVGKVYIRLLKVLFIRLMVWLARLSEDRNSPPEGKDGGSEMLVREQ